MRELILPWPPRELHPNARVHWSKRAKQTKIERKAAAYLAMMAGWASEALPEGRLHLWIDFYPPDRRKRDDDGLMASMKAARDGIADAMGIDDSRFVSHPWIKDEVRKGGEVRIRVTGSAEALEAIFPTVPQSEG